MINTLRRIPLWQIPLLYVAGLFVIWLGFAIAEAAGIYVAAFFIVGGKLLTTVATVVLVLGYMNPALRNLCARILRRLSQ
ncbi:MAG: hypothetical protein KBE09_04785 [Candidatus Pacebacteria bacterium]|nr:hypothetical protein [Candidatus Paceibacterota bacterium]